MKKSLTILAMALCLALVSASCEKKEEGDDWQKLQTEAVGLYKQGKIDEALAKAKQAQVAAEKQFGPRDENTASAMVTNADMNFAAKNYEEARDLYEAALDIMLDKLGARDVKLLAPLNNLALLYATTGDYTRAEISYQTALSIQEAVYGKDSIESAVTFNNIAELHRMRNNYAAAETFYKDSIKAYETAAGPNSPKLKRVLENLAGMYVETGREAEAIEIEKRIEGLDKDKTEPKQEKEQTGQ